MNNSKFAFDPAILPLPADKKKAEIGAERWSDSMPNEDVIKAFCNNFKETVVGQKLLNSIFGNSPYLTQCMIREHHFFKSVIEDGMDVSFQKILGGLLNLHAQNLDEKALMKALRVAKRRAALSLAIADMTESWPLLKITAGLSDIADATLEVSISHILKGLAASGHITLTKDEGPYDNHGFFILGMGKLGSRELNYSSDIDLIVLYDPDKMRATDDHEIRQACVRATRDLMRIMDSRTPDGYVFRTDLRLRPDPGATPLAMTVLAAETYYESMGQNWERAAMIKARIVAGDKQLGQSFLDHIRPFIWRKHLDFAAIQDIHSIKRQINAHRGGATVAINGHDIKIGRGGIREIEFYAQTQQLIWGGREASLRVKPTCEALTALHRFGQVSEQSLSDLTDSYHYLRKLEHRLQMVDDKQTQKMPADDDSVDAIGIFMGYQNPLDFRGDLMRHLERVEKHYAHLFEEAPDLGSSGSLVFTGTDEDADTVETLMGMGFEQASRVSGLVRTWHHGRYRATRSERARQILTELMPHLLESLADTANPDEAFIRFDAFLEGLPSGIQLFSLFQAHPAMLKLVATVMGDAPKLAKWLTKSPILLDSVITSDFNAPCDGPAPMQEKLDIALKQARDFQDMLDITRRWANDYKFKLGMQLLQGFSDGVRVGPDLSNMAEATLNGLMPWVLREFVQAHGRVPGDGIAVVAFGKLGGRELLPESDLDLVFVYDSIEGEASDGDKPLTPNVYYIRLCQRIGTAISSQTGEGHLFEVDGRLRPAGNAGALATQFDTFQKYYDMANSGEAWTWEHMALTRARVVFAKPKLKEKLEKLIHNSLIQKRDNDQVVQDIAKMRERIAKQYPGKSPWDIKHRPGGLVDVEFITQYLQLIHANRHPEILANNTFEALDNLRNADLLEETIANDLMGALSLWQNIQAMLRLTVTGEFKEETAPEGLKLALARAAEVSNFDILKTLMEEAAAKTREHFEAIITTPAKESSN